MYLNRKAQTSVEYLLVTVFALIIIASALAGIGQINNSTAAVALIKSHTLAKLNEAEYFYTIKKIEGPLFENGATKFIIDIEGTPAYNPDELEQELIEKLAIEKKLYSNVEIEFV